MNFVPTIKHAIIAGVVAIASITGLSSIEKVDAGEYVRI